MSEDTATQIDTLVARFVALQKSLGLSNRAFAAKYRKFLNSEKSWMLLKERRWRGQLNGDRWLTKLQEFESHIDAAQNFDLDEFVGELPFVNRLNLHFERLLGAARDRRCLIALAPEGMGKSWWASSVVTADPGKRVHIQLSETWRNKPLHILGGIAEKLSLPKEAVPAAYMAAIISQLRALPEMVVIIDEGHNGGAAVFPLLKEMIDKTPARFVYLAFPTQFDAVRGASVGSLAESRQLLRRCIKPIFDDWRTGISASDVEAFCAAKGLKRNGELRKVAAQLAPVLSNNYNLTTLADAFEEVEIEGKPSIQTVAEEVYALCSTATERMAIGAAA